MPPGVGGILALALSELLDFRRNLETAEADADTRRAASQQAARAARTARTTRNAAAPRLEADAGNAAAAAAEADAALTELRERLAAELRVPASELSARLDARIAELQAR